MDHIEEHKRVKDDQSQGKGKAKIFSPNWRDSRSDRYELARPRREFFDQASYNPTNAQAMNSLFKESIYRVLEKIKNEPYFKWPNKMGGDPTKRN